MKQNPGETPIDREGRIRYPSTPDKQMKKIQHMSEEQQEEGNKGKVVRG